MTQSKVDFEIEAIERAIHCALPCSRPWLKDIARSLSISSRSLQRHLMEKGTNFSRIVERAREQMACELLERDGTNVTEVAEMLGYRDTTRDIRANNHTLIPAPSSSATPSSVRSFAASCINGISGSSFDLMVMVGFGVLGWVLRKLDVPLVPIILGTLLGNTMENNLRRAITIDNGDWFALIDSPLSIGLWTLAVIGFLLPIIFGKVVKARMRHMKRDEEGSVID
ncbi:helix-turn-helix domain-containing protein [Labrenzia sp. 011]|uniref:helix-turn-helix domain-containing protein n=1 Tax=Labrenzia sp. 011 TaxID=2171494 RepID=UPI000D50D0C9|nr:hypothetical protein DCO57_20355 [Labrenzia sp. 011]